MTTRESLAAYAAQVNDADDNRAIGAMGERRAGQCHAALDSVTPGWPLWRNVSQIGSKLKRKEAALARKPRTIVMRLGDRQFHLRT